MEHCVRLGTLAAVRKELDAALRLQLAERGEAADGEADSRSYMQQLVQYYCAQSGPDRAAGRTEDGARIRVLLRLTPDRECAGQRTLSLENVYSVCSTLAQRSCCALWGIAHSDGGALARSRADRHVPGAAQSASAPLLAHSLSSLVSPLCVCVCMCAAVSPLPVGVVQRSGSARRPRAELHPVDQKLIRDRS